MFLAPNFLRGGRPEFLEWNYKIQPDSDHVQSFRAIGRGTSENAWRKKENICDKTLDLPKLLFRAAQKDILSNDRHSKRSLRANDTGQLSSTGIQRTWQCSTDDFNGEHHSVAFVCAANCNFRCLVPANVAAAFRVKSILRR